jgi:hypothetical protein
MSQIIRVDAAEKDYALFDSLKASKKKVGFPLSANLVGYSVSASAEQIYSVLSVAAPCNAMAMVSAGITTADEAQQYLVDHNFEHLIEDHAEIMQQALDRRMPPEKFLRATERLRHQHKDSPTYMDAIEAYHIASLKAYDFIPADIAEGHTKLSDIKAIGAGRLKTADSWRLIRMMLGELASGTAGYTTDDVKKFIDRHGSATVILDNSLALANRYGGQFVHELSYPDTQLRSVNYKLYDQKASDERSMSVIKYADRVSSLMRENPRRGKPPISADDIIIFHDAGIDPEEAAKGDLTALQADAIKNHGITPSVADGWL